MRKTAVLLSVAIILLAAARSQAGPCDTPRRYVKIINQGKYDSVGTLFAENALHMGPDGKTRHGRKDIAAFYATFLPRLKPQLRASRFFAHGDECVMELENKDQRTGEYAPAAVDLFTVDSAGKISSFIVYLRPGSPGARALSRALSQSR